MSGNICDKDKIDILTSILGDRKVFVYSNLDTGEEKTEDVYILKKYYEDELCQKYDNFEWEIYQYSRGTRIHRAKFLKLNTAVLYLISLIAESEEDEIVLLSKYVAAKKDKLGLSIMVKSPVYANTERKARIYSNKANTKGDSICFFPPNCEEAEQLHKRSNSYKQSYRLAMQKKDTCSAKDLFNIRRNMTRMGMKMDASQINSSKRNRLSTKRKNKSSNKKRWY